MTSGFVDLDENQIEHLRNVYLGLHLAGGHVGLPILVLTFFLSKRVHRPLTVINFCLTWIIYSICYTMLFYGGWDDGVAPPFGLCFTQASLIHGAPPMAAVAGVGLVLQAYTTYQLPWQSWHPEWVYKLPGWLISVAIVLPPYMAFAAFALSAAFLGLRHPDALTSAEHLRIHCTFKSTLGNFERFAVPAFSAGMTTIIVVLEVSAIFKYYRGWLKIKQVFPLAVRRPSLSPWFRVMVFTLYTIAVLVACVSYLSQHINPAVYVIQSALPLVATIVFATQSDVMGVWAFWRRKPKTPPLMGGGWSRPSSQQISPQFTGHLSLSSAA